MLAKLVGAELYSRHCLWLLGARGCHRIFFEEGGIKRRLPESYPSKHNVTVLKEGTLMDDSADGPKVNRRHALECMLWAGTGVLWTVAGGVPKSLSLLDDAEAAAAAMSDFTFMQISDSHVGFDKPANPHAWIR